MTERVHRVTFVLTHPAQYMAPWFRHMAATRDDVAVHVLYGTRPTPAAQAAGFGGAFEWDVPLLDGYTSTVLAPELAEADLGSERFSHLDVPHLDEALRETRPDVVVVPGWHAALYLHAIDVCRARGIPAIYRGDSTLGSGPRGWRRPFWRWHTRRRLARYDAWLAVGTRVQEYLADFRVPEPLVFHSPHAVDNARFAEAATSARRPGVRDRIRAAFGVPPDARVVLCAGKLVAQKRPLEAIRAAAHANRRVHLLFAGTGEQEAACRALADELGVAASFPGFLNQTRMPEAFAAADCLVMPSQGETWGLVVNEALASGVPCIVTDRVGCGPDLIDGVLTGRVVALDDRPAMASAIDELLDTLESGAPVAEACRARAERHSFATATQGLVAACDRLVRRSIAAQRNERGRPRILACCGNMVIPGGLERMTFAALGACREQGAAVHVVVNGWASRGIVSLAEQAGAAWSTGRYLVPFRRSASPALLARMVVDTVGTSAGLLRDAWRFTPTHVLVPEWMAVLRNWPALAWLRLRGCLVVMRLGNAPDEGRFHAALWRWAVAPFVDRFVANSQFIAGEVRRTGIDPARIEVIYNTPSRAPLAESPGPVDRTRVVYVGQVIPPKGVESLLEAVALVAARGLPITLEVLGDVDGWESPSYQGYRARVRARAQKPDLAGRVVFAGHRDDVIARLAMGAVHVCPSLPSQREGLAGTVLEAKLAGVPSVVTPTGSLPELVRHGVDGWIASAATAEAIAEGLTHFLADPGVRDRAGDEARRSLQQFSREAFSSGWARVCGVAAAPGTASPADRRMRAS